MESKLTVPHPPSLSFERLQDPSYTIRGNSQDCSVLVHYDPARSCGGVCFLAGEIWSIWGPLPFGAFVAALGGRGIQIPDGEGLARWVMACTSIPSGNTSH